MTLFGSVAQDNAFIQRPTVTIESDDRELVFAIRHGDEAAATELFNRYAKRVFGLVHSQMSDWLRSVTEPDDIVQSVFRSMFQGVKGGDFDAPPGNSLWSLIAVIAVRKTRRRATHHMAERRDARRHQAMDAIEEVAESNEGLWNEIRLDLAETLAEFKEIDRDILLARIQGYSVEEIATAKDRSERTVERSLQRSREKLADLLLGGIDVKDEGIKVEDQ